MRRYTVERTNKAEIRPEEQSEKTELGGGGGGTSIGCIIKGYFRLGCILIDDKRFLFLNSPFPPTNATYNVPILSHLSTQNKCVYWKQKDAHQNT